MSDLLRASRASGALVGRRPKHLPVNEPVPAIARVAMYGRRATALVAAPSARR